MIDGVELMLLYVDGFGNWIDFVCYDCGVKDEIVVVVVGVVEMQDCVGIFGNFEGYVLLWIFECEIVFMKVGDIVYVLMQVLLIELYGFDVLYWLMMEVYGCIVYVLNLVVDVFVDVEIVL